MKNFYIKSFSIFLISLLGILVYSNAFYCSFHLDDFPSIVDNTYIRNIHSFYSIWYFLPRRFISYLSIALNYHFSGLNVFGYHVFNLAVHLVSAILVWWLALLTLSTPVMKKQKIAHHAKIIALFAGLIFVAHPLQTQAVTYIIQRIASLATMFYLASLCFYIKSRVIAKNEATKQSFKQITTRQRIYYIGSLLTAVLAMFTKETAITLPLMILLYEVSFMDNKKNLNWKYLSPFMLTILIIPVTMLLTETTPTRIQQLQSEPGISSMHYLLTQFRVMTTYIRLLFLPLNQNLDYDYPISKSIFEFPALISFLFLISIFAWGKYLFPKYRLLSFSIFWFFLTLLPESSFLPIKDLIFEHRLYLPMAGYCLFLAASMYYLWEKKSIGGMVICLAVVTVGYSVLTYQRNMVWKNESTLWDDAVRKSPSKARTYNERGIAFEQKGDLIDALADFNRAIEIDHNYAEALNNRGLIYYGQGKFAQAVFDFNKANKIDSQFSQAYCASGIFYDKQGNFKEAIKDFTEAIKLNPNFAKAYYDRGVVYTRQDNLMQAIADYSKSIAIDPRDASVYINRGLIYAKQNKFDLAFLDFGKAVKIDPKSEVAYNNLGIIDSFHAESLQAISNFDRAIEINPKYAEGYWNRAIACYHLKKYDAAWKDVHQAKELGFAVNPQFINDLEQSSGKGR